MDFKTQIRNPKVQQSILEVIFPIAGYLFWDWSLLIIVVFYLFDYLGGQLFYVLRLKRVLNYNNEPAFNMILSAIFSFLLFFSGEVLMLNDSFSFVYDNLEKSHFQELIKFAKDELWILFPAVLAMYYMTDKMFFYMPRRFTVLKAKTYGMKNLVANIVILFLIGGGKFLFDVLMPHDLIVIFSIIIVKLLFDNFIKKKWLGIEF